MKIKKKKAEGCRARNPLAVVPPRSLAIENRFHPEKNYGLDRPTAQHLTELNLSSTLRDFSIGQHPRDKVREVSAIEARSFSQDPGYKPATDRRR